MPQNTKNKDSDSPKQDLNPNVEAPLIADEIPSRADLLGTGPMLPQVLGGQGPGSQKASLGLGLKGLCGSSLQGLCFSKGCPCVCGGRF